MDNDFNKNPFSIANNTTGTIHKTRQQNFKNIYILFTPATVSGVARIAFHSFQYLAKMKLYILDEPTAGQYQEDVHWLCRVLHRLVDERNSVVKEHHPMLLASCDWVLELGPCGGPEGGNVIAAGTPEKESALPPPTAAYIEELIHVNR